MAGVLAPQLRAARARRLQAGVQELERARHAPPVGRRRRGGGGRVARGEPGVQGRGALGLQHRGPALARAGGRGRAQVEVGQRRAQVEPRAAHDDRPPPGGEQRVDLRVGAARVVAGRGARGQRQDAHEPVLQGGALGGRRRAREHLQAAVDLQRVGGDGDGILPGGAQALRERDGHGRLSHPGRAEQRDDRGRGHGAQDGSARGRRADGDARRG